MPVTPASSWFHDQGFSLIHTPGIARAWRLELADQSHLIVTDIGGYDLPELGGPYSVLLLSQRDELVEYVPLLERTKDLYRFLKRQQRRIQNPISSEKTSVSY